MVDRNSDRVSVGGDLPLGWLLCAYLVFVVYGSLIPFAANDLSFGAAFKAFADIPYFRLGAASRADWVANLILYIPVGFLAAGAWRTGRLDAGAGFVFPVVFLACAALALLIEFTQLFFPPRTVSLNDLGAEIVGAGAGIALWAVAGGRLAALWRAIAGGGREAVVAALLLYLLFYAFLNLFPFDVVASRAELADKFAGDKAGLLLAGGACGGVLRCGAKLTLEAASIAPLGMLLAMLTGVGGAGRARRAMVAFGIGAALGILFEIVQIFLVSGVSQGLSVLTRAAGMAIGATMVGLAGRGAAGAALRHRLRPLLRPVLLLGVLPYLALVLGLNRWLTGSWSLDGWQDKLGALNLLPFYYHYYTTEQAALFSLAMRFALYAPIGAAWWMWAAARRDSAGAPVGRLTPALLAAALALVMEAGQLWLVGRRPDPTNILIAFAAAWVASALCQWVARWAGLAPADTAP